jgi:hypothetical protein
MLRFTVRLYCLNHIQNLKLYFLTKAREEFFLMKSIENFHNLPTVLDEKRIFTFTRITILLIILLHHLSIR